MFAGTSYKLNYFLTTLRESINNAHVFFLLLFRFCYCCFNMLLTSSNGLVQHCRACLTQWKRRASEENLWIICQVGVCRVIWLTCNLEGGVRVGWAIRSSRHRSVYTIWVNGNLWLQIETYTRRHRKLVNMLIARNWAVNESYASVNCLSLILNARFFAINFNHRIFYKNNPLHKDKMANIKIDYQRQKTILIFHCSRT